MQPLACMGAEEPFQPELGTSGRFGRAAVPVQPPPICSTYRWNLDRVESAPFPGVAGNRLHSNQKRAHFAADGICECWIRPRSVSARLFEPCKDPQDCTIPTFALHQQQALDGDSRPPGTGWRGIDSPEDSRHCVYTNSLISTASLRGCLRLIYRVLSAPEIQVYVEMMISNAN